MQKSADVVIIGAGVIGCSTAYHLAQQGVTDVVIVEMGQPGSGSSSKSASMLSLQFSHDELGARMAQRAYARYMQFEQEIGVPIDFHRTGWLSVATHEAAPALLAGSAMLRSLGIASEALTPAEIAYRYPLLCTDDLAVGVFGPDDGPFDPHMILWGYLRRARESGARLLIGVRATGLAVQGDRVTGVHTDQGFIAAGMVINAAGPWAAEVAAWAGLDLPLRNRARTILVTGALPAVPRDHPFVEDVATEWYFRPEGDGVLMGMGQEPVPMESLEHPATDAALVDAMIDVAVHRVPALASASMLTTWTGVRPLTPDGRPVLGAAPGIDGLLLNCGWGGVGIILAPVAGQLLAELVCQGHAATFDITPFSFERFVHNPWRLT
jgi:sarcosine oxidase, subunit beta